MAATTSRSETPQHPHRTFGDFDLTRIGASGNGSIAVRVAGYWSADTIRMYVRREWMWNGTAEDNGQWRVELSHSSGGRETDPAKGGLASDLDAETNFGAALIATAALGRTILAQVPALEAAYQAQRKLDNERRAEEEAAKQARIDADPAIGTTAADQLVTNALLSVKTAGGNTADRIVTITARPRGNDDHRSTQTFVALIPAYRDRAVLRHQGAAISRADMVAKLAALSAASCTPTPPAV